MARDSTLSREQAAQLLGNLYRRFKLRPSQEELDDVYEAVKYIKPHRLERVIHSIIHKQKTISARTNIVALVEDYNRRIPFAEVGPVPDCEYCGGTQEIIVHRQDDAGFEAVPLKCMCAPPHSRMGMLFFEACVPDWRMEGITVCKGHAFIDDRIVLVDFSTNTVTPSPATGRGYINWCCLDCNAEITYWSAVRWDYHCRSCYQANHIERTGKPHKHSHAEIRAHYIGASKSVETFNKERELCGAEIPPPPPTSFLTPIPRKKTPATTDNLPF